MCVHVCACVCVCVCICVWREDVLKWRGKEEGKQMVSWEMMDKIEMHIASLMRPSFTWRRSLCPACQQGASCRTQRHSQSEPCENTKSAADQESFIVLKTDG